MINQKFLKYVDDVMSRITAPEEIKTILENELIRHIISASERKSINEVINELGSPEELAYEMSRESAEMSKKSGNNFVESGRQNLRPAKISGESYREPAPMRNYDRYVSPMYCGEFTREASNVNIKVLFIPLIQISSGTERIRMPLM